jgi:Protein of unknown function (DUF1638)
VLPVRTKVIACRIFADELRQLLPAEVAVETLEMSLHERPRSLRQLLQERIDATADCDTIILGYGACGQATVGLRATHCRLVLPRVDDCIGMFLGSRAAYRAQHEQEPGTYFLTKGWVGAGVTTPFATYDAVRERWGAERADRIMGTMLGRYRRLAFIRTGDADDAMAHASGQARTTARRFGLRYEEIDGSLDLVYPLLHGPWDERFIVVPTGGTVRLTDFLGDGRKQLSAVKTARWDLHWRPGRSFPRPGDSAGPAWSACHPRAV